MKYILLLSLGLVSMLSNAQETFVSSAASATGTGGHVSHSVGQLFTSSQVTSNVRIDVGIQIPLQILTLNHPELKSIQLTAFPNPSTDFVVLSLTAIEFEKMHYTIHSLKGEIIKKASLTAASTVIDIRSLSDGTYIVRVTQDHQELKTFKIIKK